MSSDPSESRFGKIRERFSQLALIFRTTRESDPRLVPILAVTALVFISAGVVVGLATGQLLFSVPLGTLLAVMAAMVVFGRRATKAQFTAIEGKPGAAAAVLQSTRGRWLVTPAVAFTRKQDLVHRAVGRAGVVLVGEGSPARVSSLLRQEHRKVARVVGETPVHEVSVGNGQGQVPLPKLQGHLAKLPRALKRGEVGALERRLGSLGDADLPIPKGPLPRPPRGKRR